MASEGEHAPAAGQVPLFDGRVRGPGEDVAVVDEHARDVTLVPSCGLQNKIYIFKKGSFKRKITSPRQIDIKSMTFRNLKYKIIICKQN